MLVVGVQGSPRKNGNTNTLLSAFLHEAEKLGAKTQTLDVPRMIINPCQECGTCEAEGYCPIDDDMQEVYHLFREADLIVLASPVFFYGVTAQIKALVDRAQNLWARRYVLNLTDPGQKSRLGFTLFLGATKGKNLFDGIDLMAKYFFDAVGADFKGGLHYRRIEAPGDINEHPTALADATKKGRELITPFLSRNKILFLCKENACRSQMAGAFARLYAGDKFDVNSAGSAPAKDIDPVMEEAMREKGIDVAYRRPQSIKTISDNGSPSLIVTMGCGDACPMFPGVQNIEWDLPDPSGKPIEFMRELRDEIEKRVKELIASAS